MYIRHRRSTASRALAAAAAGATSTWRHLEQRLNSGLEKALLMRFGFEGLFQRF